MVQKYAFFLKAPNISLIICTLPLLFLQNYRRLLMMTFLLIGQVTNLPSQHYLLSNKLSSLVQLAAHLLILTDDELPVGSALRLLFYHLIEEVTKGTTEGMPAVLLALLGVIEEQGEDVQEHQEAILLVSVQREHPVYQVHKLP